MHNEKVCRVLPRGLRRQGALRLTYVFLLRATLSTLSATPSPYSLEVQACAVLEERSTYSHVHSSCCYTGYIVPAKALERSLMHAHPAGCSYRTYARINIRT